MPHDVVRPAFLDALRAAADQKSAPYLCYGMGRSYGDVCLNARHRLIVTDTLDRIVSVDWQRGILRAEAGLTFDRLLSLTVPHGWFAPVVPGTKFATLGGAVANDVHGKNHEQVGTLGAHVTALGLMRSSGEMLTLSREENAELFAATIGGLGLTGVIAWVELQLAPIKSAMIDSETFALNDLSDFFKRAEESRDWAYTVAWIDCLAKGAAAGRGFFTRGRHSEHGELTVHTPPRLAVPFDAPGALLNAHTIALFNLLY
ncbi:MAG TPA: FAD-binding oxidoreductase, partial [Xanthobacteraceae bacterium]|nr:FAD-binding oxidoreductase [Xanthobacteraceae bacterium]